MWLEVQGISPVPHPINIFLFKALIYRHDIFSADFPQSAYASRRRSDVAETVRMYGFWFVVGFFRRSIYESGGEEHIANVYDIEPHKRDEGEFGRMLRYRQAKIDSRYMKKNDNDFSHLPNLYMLLITDKDYFGKDYMLYTFRNRCVELPELEYNDGLCFLYYYTKGTKGGSESIHNMLKYIQDSKRGSAVDDATRELDEYVSNVRRDPEIRGNYMTFGDRIDWEKQMSLEEGIEQGKVQIVENMLKKGKSSAEIADLCGLEVSSVLKIEENMKTLA